MAILGKCPRCGYLLTEEKPVCPRCGISGVVRQPSSTGWTTSSGAGSSVSDTGTSGRNRWAMALVAALVVVLLGVVIYRAGQRGEQSSGGSDGGRVSAPNPSDQQRSSGSVNTPVPAPNPSDQQRSSGSVNAPVPAPNPSDQQRSSGSAQAPSGSVIAPVPAPNRNAEIKIVTKPDPQKAGNMGIGLTLVVNGKPVYYSSLSPNTPKANIVVKKPDGQIIHQDTAGLDKFTFG